MLTPPPLPPPYPGGLGNVLVMLEEESHLVIALARGLQEAQEDEGVDAHGVEEAGEKRGYLEAVSPQTDQLLYEVHVPLGSQIW